MGAPKEPWFTWEVERSEGGKFYAVEKLHGKRLTRRLGPVYHRQVAYGMIAKLTREETRTGQGEEVNAMIPESEIEPTMYAALKEPSGGVG